MGFVAAYIWVVFYPSKPDLQSYGQELNRIIQKRSAILENQLERSLQALESYPSGSDSTNGLWTNEFFISTLEESYTLAVYKDNNIIFWNNPSASLILPDSLITGHGILMNSSGYFIFSAALIHDYYVLVAEPIYISYPIQNQYLQQGFTANFSKFKDKIKIINDLSTSEAYELQIASGKPLFIDFVFRSEETLDQQRVLFIDFLISFILLWLAILTRVIIIKLPRLYFLRLKPYFPFLLILITAALALMALPVMIGNFAEHRLLFTTSLWFDYFPTTAGLLFLLLSLNINDLLTRQVLQHNTLEVLRILLGVVMAALVGELLFSALLRQSASTEAFLSGKEHFMHVINQVIGLLLTGSASIYFIGNQLVVLQKLKGLNKWALLGMFIPWLVLVLVYTLFGRFLIVTAVLPVAIFIALLPVLFPTIKPGENLPVITSWIIVSVCLALFVSISNQRIADDEQMLTAKKLSADKDPLLEFLFVEMKDKLDADTLFNLMLFEQNADDPALNAYIRENYLQGYLSKYETEVTTCYASQDLILQPENRKVNCIGYFRSLSALGGDSLMPGGLYLIDNNLLGIHYIGYLAWADQRNRTTDSLHVFIEFYYKYIPEGTGYPDLLIDAGKGIGPDLNKYSFASYRDGMLYYKFGSYFFPLRLDQMTLKNEGYFNRENYRHSILKFDNKTLIISRKEKNLAELLAPFSFFLLLNGLIILLLGWSLQGVPDFRKAFSTFRTRLQLIISVSLLVTFAMIGFITTVYLADIYRKKNDDFLAEKTQSLIVELEHKLNDFPLNGAAMRDYLNQILLKFSLVFFTDINLYDVDGQLLATSRPEIFDLGLTGDRMHPDAFRAMHIQNRLYLRQYEEIGKARYISAYAPFKSSSGEVNAYVNLPYFVKESEMQREVRSMVLSYLNMFLLLSALSLLFALFVSRRLTRPLQMIQQKMSRLQLGHSNEKINYQGSDEIGELVNQYNTLLDQLAESAELLARSERESAWREMARQVAHEIKNPLTPMRLSVQYLLRAWDDKDPDIDQKIKNISQTLISQIDTLSSIASAFSDFALMPQPRPIKIELAEVLRKVINLFDHQENIRFALHIHSSLPAFVDADPENLNRIFTNLIKNSIQAIGNKPDARITISLDETPDGYVVEVEDTGKGMTDEEARKIFTPNFTTKSSGMGMGLSIVHSLVQQTGGKIRFETRIGQGTTFTLELPKAAADA